MIQQLWEQKIKGIGFCQHDLPVAGVRRVVVDGAVEGKGTTLDGGTAMQNVNEVMESLNEVKVMMVVLFYAKQSKILLSNLLLVIPAIERY